MMYQLIREQILNVDRESAWQFFTSPMNLSKITPPDMKFMVMTKNMEPVIFEGMIIDYIVSPLFKIPVKWKTKITQVDDFKSFTDVQLKGPYRYWNHLHEFSDHQNGILMRDTVNYELPLGVLGQFAQRILVGKKIEYIFDYRKEVLDNLFNSGGLK